jgi:acyl carrier protein
MIPSDIVILDELPWLPNFKTDRKRLEAMDAAKFRRDSAAALEPDVATLVRAFEQVLGLEGVGPDDDLQSLGGDSLQAVDIGLELADRLGVCIAPEAIDVSCPIDQLAQRLGIRRLVGLTGPAE